VRHEVRLKELFRDAEAERRCLVPSNESERRQLVRLRKAGELVSPDRGTFARSIIWESLDPREQAMVRMRTLSAMHASWVFCGVSAAIAYDLEVPVKLMPVLHVCIPGASHGRSLDALMRHHLPACKTEIVHGILVTCPERTITDVLCGLDFPDGLAAADSFLRETGITRKDLGRILDDYPRLHGIRQARLTAAHADGRSENGGESKARATILRLGYAAPELQVEIDDPIEEGRGYRVDFLWECADGRLVAGELDGRQKYSDPHMTQGRSTVDVMADERLRESRIAATGVMVMRFSFADTQNDQWFSHILDAFGIPKADPCLVPDQDLRPPRTRQ
jgi:hypothetical protein